MPDTPLSHAKAIFLAALECDGAEARERFLSEACAGDEALRQRVEQLLAARMPDEAFPEMPDLTDMVVPEPEGAVPLPGDAIGYFGEYLLLEEIARGGSGVVFRARQVSLNRTVALKMLRTSPGVKDDGIARRFKAEAEAAATLDHPNIVPIYEVGVHEGQDYFSMKLVEGGTLSAHLRAYQADRRRAAALMVKVCRAVHHAHQQAILHRDIKPGNILVDAAGEPQVTDFGLARHLEMDLELTVTGMVMGTPHYMSPEQARGESRRLTVATDVYSLGAVLFELMAGRRAFTGEGMMEVLQKVIHDPPPLLRSVAPHADRDMETIVARCLDKSPASRYGSAAALADDIEHWLRGEPVTARRVSAAERLWKWAKRKPALAAAAGLAALFAIGLVIALAVSRHWVGQALEKSEASLTLARQSLDRAEGRVAYMTTVLPDLLEPVGRLDLLDGPFRNVEEYYSTLPPGARDAAALSRHAAFLSRWSEVLWKVGDRRERLERLEQAAALVEEALQQPDRQPAVWVSAATVFRALSEARSAFNDPGGAKKAADRAREVTDEGLRLFPSELLLEHEQANLRLVEIRRLQNDGKNKEAAELAAAEAPVWRSLFARALDPASPGARACRSKAGEFFVAWSETARATGQSPIAILEEFERLAAEARRRLPDDAHTLTEHGFALAHLGVAWFFSGDKEKSGSFYRRYLEVAQTAHERDPSSLALRMELVLAQSALARYMRDVPDIEEERRLLEAAVAGLDSIQARDGALDHFVNDARTSTLFMYANNLNARGLPEQAFARMNESLAAKLRMTAGRAEEWSPHAALEDFLRSAEGRLNGFTGGTAEVRPFLERALAAMDELKKSPGSETLWQWNRGLLLRRLSRHILRQPDGSGAAEAWPLMEESADLLTRALQLPGAHPGMCAGPAAPLLAWLEAAPADSHMKITVPAQAMLRAIPAAEKLDPQGSWRADWAKVFSSTAVLLPAAGAEPFSTAAARLQK